MVQIAEVVEDIVSEVDPDSSSVLESSESSESIESIETSDSSESESSE